MTHPKYKQIILNINIYKTLSEQAKRRKMSIGSYIQYIFDMLITNQPLCRAKPRRHESGYIGISVYIVYLSFYSIIL